MKVPFSDISFDQEELDAVSNVLSSGWPSRGKVSAEFEAALGKYLGSNVALVNSGSSALLCALLARGQLGTVLVSDFTFVATASIPAILGNIIVPVDCDLETFNMLEFQKNFEGWFENSITGKGTTILTDVAGLPIHTKRDANVIEDAAEAFGAETILGKVGAREYLTCFSFNATKSLSTVEGGAIASKNEELIKKCRSIANYGRTSEQYIHDRLGMNMRITDISSALGLISLRKLDKNLARRKEIADRYRKELPQFQFQKIPRYVTKATNYWMIALTETPDKRGYYISKFQRAGIDARYLFQPIHMQPCFPGLPVCNNSAYVFFHGLALPIFNSMTNEQVSYVIDTAHS